MTFWILRGFTLGPCKFGPLLEEILATPLLTGALLEGTNPFSTFFLFFAYLSCTENIFWKLNALTRA